LLWTKPAAGATGLSGDSSLLLGVEFDGTLQAWRRNDGERAWSSQQLRFRQLTAPLVLGGLVVLGDEGGRLHVLSRTDGALQTRLETDGSPITVTPVLAGNTLVVVTRKGRVLGLRPE
jgi:outer membrane protein assembly factor BamB